MNSLQKAGGIFSLVALSPSVGTYSGGRFTGNVPNRVVQPTTHTNNSIDLQTMKHDQLVFKHEGECRNRKRQVALTLFDDVVRSQIGGLER